MAGNENSGRAPYEPTDADREKVRVLKAVGMSVEAIAEAMGLAVNTLKKYFADDMEIAVAKVTAEMWMARYEAAKDHKIPAQNKMLEQLGAVKVGVPRQPAAPKIGKKEQQKIAAKKVGNRFAVPEAPRLVIDNK